MTRRAQTDANGTEGGNSMADSLAPENVRISAAPDAPLTEVMAAIDGVVDPCSIATGVPISVIDMGLLEEVDIRDDVVSVVIRTTTPICWQSTNIVEAVVRRVEQVAGIRACHCTVNPGWDWRPEMMSEEARARLRRVRPLDRVNQTRP
jgi:metal-sulfur cluster biosynthetic enzyme